MLTTDWLGSDYTRQVTAIRSYQLEFLLRLKPIDFTRGIEVAVHLGEQRLKIRVLLKYGLR